MTSLYALEAAKAATVIGRKKARAEEFMNRYLADANEASESGNKPRAEALYAKSQFWLDQYNKLAGNS